MILFKYRDSGPYFWQSPAQIFIVLKKVVHMKSGRNSGRNNCVKDREKEPKRDALTLAHG